MGWSDAARAAAAEARQRRAKQKVTPYHEARKIAFASQPKYTTKVPQSPERKQYEKDFKAAKTPQARAGALRKLRNAMDKRK